MSESVCVVVPSIPPRGTMLMRALRSVAQQTLSPYSISIAIDTDREGAWTTRNRALERSSGEWIAFLDDDDCFLPHHLEFLLDLARNNRADVSWGWFEVIGGGDPFPQHRGKQYHPYPHDDYHCIPITYLARRDLAMEAMEKMGGFLPDEPGFGAWEHQDRKFLDAMYELSGGAFHGSDRTTWQWFHHQLNTSGLPSRW